MEEVIVRVLRTAACFTRLRIVARLANGKEATPSQLAAELGLSRALVCVHLAKLASAGLIKRRRSGLRCYCVAQSPYDHRTLSGQVTAWLCEALRSATWAALGDSAPGRRGTNAARTAAEQLRTVFDACTAFTSPRRIQLMRRLSRGDAAGVEALTRELHMSGAALGRHTDKLIRRGYLTVSRAGRSLVYRLARQARTWQHARLLKIVQAHWAG